MPAAAIDAIWSPMHLERLARTYWRFLTPRARSGLIRVEYTDASATSCSARGRSCCCVPGARVRDGRRARHRPLADRARRARRPARARRRRLPRDRHPPRPAATSPARSTCTSRSRSRTSTRRSPSRLSALAVHGHAVAHPRDRHARLPALARAAGPRGVEVGRFERRRRCRSATPDPRGRCREPRSGRVGRRLAVRAPVIARSFARSCARVDRGGPCPSASASRATRSSRRRAPSVAHALQHVAVGDAGGREEAVVAGDEVVAGRAPASRS